MAAHVLSHGLSGRITSGADTLPGTFPPAGHVSSRSHGAVSKYEMPFVMSRQNQVPYPHVEGSLDITFDDEELPTSRPRAPSANTAVSLGYLSSDPTLCLTPEKSRSLTGTYREKLNRGSDVGLSEKARHSQKVRFDNFVEVKQMTPEEAGSNRAQSMTSKHLNGKQKAPVIKPQEIFADSEPFVDVEGSSIMVPDENESDQELLSQSSRIEAIVLSTDSTHSRICAQSASLPDRQHDSQSDEDPEVISIMASEIPSEKLASKSKVKTTSSSSGRIKTANKSQRSHVPDPVPAPQPFQEVPEHVLARPEFNSTLKVGRELKQLTSEQLNVTAAVKQKLQTSRKTHDNITEKATSKVNTESDLFLGLVPLEVSDVDLLSSVEKEKASRVHPTTSSKSGKPEDSLVAAPDIFDFLTPDLLKETGSLTLEGLPPVDSDPCMVPLSRTFDVFRHMRTWENW